MDLLSFLFGWALGSPSDRADRSGTPIEEAGTTPGVTFAFVAGMALFIVGVFLFIGAILVNPSIDVSQMVPIVPKWGIPAGIATTLIGLGLLIFS